MNSIIQIEKIFKTYKGAWRKPPKQALNGVSLAIEEGEAFGFIGPNGAGKSTLIKILIGVLRSTAGSARIFGLDVRDPEARRGLGFVPENPSLQNFLTPYEILMMGLQMHGTKVSDERKHCLFWLERFDLLAVADNPLRGFSKGMMQRTALAQALAIKPRLMILDEPLSGLDPVGRKDVVDILEEYQKGGGTLFFSSHVLHDVERIADRFGLIHQGVLQSVSSPVDLANESEIFTVRSIGEKPVEGLLAQSGNRWVAEVRRESLWELLQRLEFAGHVLLEVKPELTLEIAFIRATKSPSI